MTDNPQMTGVVQPCEKCDAMATLGILTCHCETISNPLEKVTCQNALKPLEEGSQTAAEAVANIIVKMGPDKFNETMDRIDLIVLAGAEKAKQILIDQGKLNKDGTPK